jgi:hypothetical protein
MALGLVISAGTAAVLCGIAYVMAARPALRPAAVGPFAPTPADPSADTLSGQARETVFADHGWQSVTLNNLREVEDLLDSLEAHRVAEREVHALGNAAFCVRWR